MSKTDVYWLQSINCKEGGRMIGGTGPLVLVSSAHWFSVAGEKRRGEERRDGRGTSHFSHSEEDFQTVQEK